MCQACFRRPAEHHCQACRRYVCDGCVSAPPAETAATSPDAPGYLEAFLQAAMTRCRACRDDAVRLPPHDLTHEPVGPT